MKQIEIREPVEKDILEIENLFYKTIKSVFVKNNYDLSNKIFKEEIESKKIIINDYIKNPQNNQYFLIAVSNHKIVGIMGYYKVSQLIIECTNSDLVDYYEIGSAYIHPDFQRKGIANLLLEQLIKRLKHDKITKICLDSGYKSAQEVWTKKFGTPAYHLKDFWGEGIDHMVWTVEL